MNYVYFSESAASGAGTAAAYPVENFMGFESASATTGRLYFKPIVHVTDQVADGDENENILVTFPNTGTTGNLNFAQIAEIVCGAIRGSKPSGAMTVIADELNGNYISPLTGTVTITVGG
jgi:hypothetical protein